MYNTIKRELYARSRMFWNQILHGRLVAVFWLWNVQKWPFKLGRMYQTAHQNDGFNVLRLCYNKLNSACLCYDSKPAKLQGMMSNATSQPSSRTAKLGKFTFLSRTIKRSDIHLEVLSSQNHKSLRKSFWTKKSINKIPFICRINFEKYFIKAIENFFPVFA